MRYGKFKKQIVHQNSSSLFLAKLLKRLQKSIIQTIINILQNTIAHNYAAINFNYTKANVLPACVHSPPQYF
jgi:hypothetical protein